MATTKKKSGKWLQKAAAGMKKRGTEGSFTAFCKRLGYGGVTAACIAKGLASKDPKIRKRAAFAKSMKKIARK